MKRSELYALVLLTVLFVACAGKIAPKDPLWNRETCAHCRMTLSEPRYAAQLIGPGATVRYYDDLGCALVHRYQKAELRDGRLYVRPHGSETWIDANDAKYLANLNTPMGFGFGAVAAGGEMSLPEVVKEMNLGAQ